MSLHPLQLTCSNHGVPASEWTAERLQELVLSTAGGQVMVVSCREPYYIKPKISVRNVG
jgi:hypothetical protein